MRNHDRPAAAPSRAVASLRRGVCSLVCVLAFAFVAASAQEPTRGEAAEGGASARRSEASRAPGTITGRVSADDGRVLPGVAVYAYTRAAGPQRNRQTLTGEDGRFRFDNLEPGAYLVWASASGYVPAPRPTAERELRVFHRLGDDVQINLQRGGVITGMVTDSRGAPVVAVRVRAVLVRTSEGRAVEGSAGFSEQQTDDRGVYRIYGLAPGGYVVSAGGPSRSGGLLTTPYGKDAPTFFPSGTRDVASEVAVLAGQEAAGIDIRYRGARGHSVSGVAEGTTGTDGGIRVELAHAATGHVETSSAVFGLRSDRTFTFDGLNDGDYDLTAYYSSRDGDQMVSAPRRVSVRGADVTGVRLALAPLASVSGRLRLEVDAAATGSGGAAAPKPDGAGVAHVCEAGEAAVPQEAVVTLLRDEPEPPKGQPRTRPTTRLDTSPDARGDFQINSLTHGRYRLQILPPGPDWYVRSVTFPGAQTPTPRPAATNTRRPTPASAAAADSGTARVAPPRQPSGVTTPADSLTLRQGERASGLLVVVARGAASLRGRVHAAHADEAAPATAASTSAPLPLPARLRVHLLPADPREDDPLRYAEVPAAPDGSFAFNNLAPGRYLLLARPLDTPPDAPARPLAWDADARARLRREAEAAKLLVELQPCQRAADFALRYPATKQ